jgi:hypothetical protein
VFLIEFSSVEDSPAELSFFLDYYYYYYFFVPPFVLLAIVVVVAGVVSYTFFNFKFFSLIYIKYLEFN